MPQGNLVSLGNNSLDSGDAISGGVITFTTDTVLGTWTWGGTAGGVTYTNKIEPSNCYLATTGNASDVGETGGERNHGLSWSDLAAGARLECRKTSAAPESRLSASSVSHPKIITSLGA